MSTTKVTEWRMQRRPRRSTSAIVVCADWLTSKGHGKKTSAESTIGPAKVNKMRGEALPWP
ncbi:hypothetical protein [Paenibacillus roseus]|uniref:hypothetical protein n=1 Tax=Paenibacillus sp. GCM10012307 TaxID=3317343 RepID=UPI0036D39787